MQEKEDSRGSSIRSNLNGEANFRLGRADATSQKMLLKLSISLSILPTALPPDSNQMYCWAAFT